VNGAVRWDVDRPDLSWTIDLMHNPKPYPPLMHDFRQFIAEGTSRAFLQLGIPTRVAYQGVNGYAYGARERLQAVPAERSVADRSASLWQDWQNQYLPEIQAIYAAWDVFAITQADQPALRAHLEWVADRSVRLWEIHFVAVEPAFHSLETFFDFYRREIPGSSDLDAAALLQGYPNVLTGVDERLWALAVGDPARPDHHAAVTEFLRVYGALGDEQGEFFSHSWAEDPAQLAKEVARHAGLPDPRTRRRDLAAARETRQAAVRARLSAPTRERFDVLHAQARVGNVLSEDHHFYIDRQWLWRIKRLCAGCGLWLAARGQVDDPGDVAFLTLDELRAGISDAVDVSGRAPERRTRFAQQRDLSPPRALGKPAGEEKADRFRGAPVPQGMSRTINGLAASPGLARGRAVVMTSMADLDGLEQGDVLVCGTTNASLVPFFERIGALVTDTGGVLSHAAVVAREFGLPAVVGTEVATQRIRTGQRVEVDGSTGEVRLL